MKGRSKHGKRSADVAKIEKGQKLLTSFFSPKKLNLVAGVSTKILSTNLSQSRLPNTSLVNSSSAHKCNRGQSQIQPLSEQCDGNSSDVEFIAEIERPKCETPLKSATQIVECDIDSPRSQSSTQTISSPKNARDSRIVRCRSFSSMSSSNGLELSVDESLDCRSSPNDFSTALQSLSSSCAPTEPPTEHQAWMCGVLLKDGSPRCNLASELCQTLIEEDEAISEAVASSEEIIAASDSNNPYYLQSFTHILESVLADASSARLLDECDQDVIERFTDLPLRSRMLYVRLFQRKVKWLRVDLLNYSEIGDQPVVTVEALHRVGFVDIQLNDVPGALDVLNTTELRQLCQRLHVSAGGVRSSLLEQLGALGRRQRTLFGASSLSEVVLQQARTLAGPCVRLVDSVRRVFLRMVMLYSIPQYEDLEDANQRLWSLSSVRLGKLCFPRVVVVKETSVFGCRDDLMRYEQASDLEVGMREHIDNKNWDAAHTVYLTAERLYQEWTGCDTIRQHDTSLPVFLRKYTAVSLLTYIRNQGVDILQRRKDYVAAVSLLRSLLDESLYLPDYRGRWFDRLSLNLHQHMRQPSEARSELLRGLQDSWVRAGHRLALQHRLDKLRVSCKDVDDVETTSTGSQSAPVTAASLPSLEIEARCVTTSTHVGDRRLFLVDLDDGGGDGAVSCSVEELVLSRYRSDGFARGAHCEERMVKTLYVLLFWDILYEARVGDAFHSDLQAAPLDLNSDSFHARRTALIDARLDEIGACRYDERIVATWQANEGTTSLAHWDVFRDVQHAQSLARCMGAHLLRAVCQRFAVDHRFHRSGFPDLTVWDESGDGRCKFVEVKGPNDRLSTKQMLWVEYLNRHGRDGEILAEVCYVRAVGARRARLRTYVDRQKHDPAEQKWQGGVSPTKRPRKSRTNSTLNSPTRESPPSKATTCSQKQRGGAGRRSSRNKSASLNIQDNDDSDFVS